MLVCLVSRLSASLAPDGGPFAFVRGASKNSFNKSHTLDPIVHGGKQFAAFGDLPAFNDCRYLLGCITIQLSKCFEKALWVPSRESRCMFGARAVNSSLGEPN